MTMDLVGIPAVENATQENNIEKCHVTKSNNNIRLYASWATSGVLLAALIVVIAKRKV